MRYRFRGQCSDCGHEWDGLWRRMACGRIDFHDASTYRRYVCTRCEVELDVARFASRSGWLRWVSQNASELTQSPLDFAASELGVRVDCAVARRDFAVGAIIPGLRNDFQHFGGDEVAVLAGWDRHRGPFLPGMQ